MVMIRASIVPRKQQEIGSTRVRRNGTMSEEVGNNFTKGIPSADLIVLKPMNSVDAIPMSLPPVARSTQNHVALDRASYALSKILLSSS